MQMKIRESKFELLRIFSMLMIIFQHALERSIPDWGMLKGAFSFNYCVVVLIGIWGQLGVMIFVMISSWFMVDKQGIRMKKVIDLLLEVMTFCIGMLLIFSIVYPKSINIKLIVKELATPAYKQYWFITTFLAFYLIMPLLQKLVSSLSNIALRNTCIVLTLLIPIYNYLFVNVGDTLADFSYIFIMTAYLKRNPDNWFKRNHRMLLLILPLISVSLILFKLFAEHYLGEALLLRMFTMLRGRTFLLFLGCVGIFYTFENMKSIHSSGINLIGSTMFGVYLIHENILLRGETNGASLLWNKLIPIGQSFKSGGVMFSVHYIISVLAIFGICILIKLLHKFTIEKIYTTNQGLIQLGNKLDLFYGKRLWMTHENEKKND